MITAFLADVHGNFEALTKISSYLMRERVDRVVFLGDIVGYGASPNECIELLRELAIQSALGNHDAAAATNDSAVNFNPVARVALAWTSSVLAETSRQFLAALPLSLETGGVLGVHASPASPDQWGYVSGIASAADAFSTFVQQVCVIGHTHVPAAYIESTGKAVNRVYSSEIPIEDGSRFIINCGSVGQPRDGDPRACCGILDMEKGLYRLERVAYDIAAAQKKIIQAGLPAFLAERIAAGR